MTLIKYLLGIEVGAAIGVLLGFEIGAAIGVLLGFEVGAAIPDLSMTVHRVAAA